MESTLRIMRKGLVALVVTALLICGCGREKVRTGVTPKVLPKVAQGISDLHKTEYWRTASLELIWSAGLVSKPVKALVAEKHLLVVDDNNMIFAIDKSRKGRGVIKWRQDIGKPIDGVTVGHKEVLVLSRDELFRIKEDDGRLIWRKTLGFVPSSDVIRGQMSIISGAWGKKLYGVDLDTCFTIWESKPGGNVVGSMINLGARLYLVTDNGHLYALRAHNGSEEWHRDLKGKTEIGVVTDKDAVYAPSVDNAMFAYSRHGEGLLWTCRTKGPIVKRPLAVGGWVYFMAEGDGFYAVHHRGKRKWRFDGEWKALSMGKERVYLLKGADTIVAVDKNSGKQRATVRVPGFTIFPQNKSGPEIFCVSPGGNILALSERQ